MANLIVLKEQMRPTLQHSKPAVSDPNGLEKSTHMSLILNLKNMENVAMYGNLRIFATELN